MANIKSYLEHVVKVKPPEETIRFLHNLSHDLISAFVTDKSNWTPWNNVANYLNEAGDYDLAEECIKKAISLSKNEQTYYNAAIIVQNTNKHYKAIEYYRKALEINPSNKQAQFNMCMSLLVEEQWQEGFKLYDTRLELFDKCIEMRQRWKDVPLWQGEDISNKKLVIFSEQGTGDVIQFMRFIPRIKAKEIVIEVQKHLATMLTHLGHRVIPREDENWPAGEPCDVCVSVCSLPGIFNMQTDGKPYLPAPTHINIEPNDKLKVGICFAGSNGHAKDWMRSCHLKWFEGIHKLDFVQLYCLQKELYQGTDWDKDAHLSFIACGPYLNTFADTASLLRKLDLVITVDTSVAHLAGALGVPCWMLIATQPDWRWGLDKKTTKWYDSVRLFRQKKWMDWSDPFNEIEEALKECWKTHNFLP